MKYSINKKYKSLCIFNQDGDRIFYMDSSARWFKREEYDQNDDKVYEIYYHHSFGDIEDNR